MIPGVGCAFASVTVAVTQCCVPTVFVAAGGVRTKNAGVPAPDPVTVIAAVGPVGATGIAPASPPALLKYTPVVVATVTLKCNMTSPEAGTLNGPAQVSVWPEIPGFVVVTPVLEPAVYVKPAGSVSVIEVSVAALAFGLWIVIVYPSLAPPAAVAASAVLVVESGASPSGEKVVKCETVRLWPAGIINDQLSPAPLSMLLAHAQVSGNGSFAPILAQTVLKPDSKKWLPAVIGNHCSMRASAA